MSRGVTGSLLSSIYLDVLVSCFFGGFKLNLVFRTLSFSVYTWNDLRIYKFRVEHTI